MSLFDVRPLPASGCSADRGLRHAEAARQLPQPDPTRTFQAYRAHRLLRETSVPVALPSEHFGRIDALRVLVASQSPMTTLAIAIARIHGRRSEKQMVRPDARRIVAVVADAQIVGRFTEVDGPRNTMGELAARMTARAAVEHAVPRSVAVPRPLPASFGLSDLPPETLLSSRQALRCPSTTPRTELRPSFVPDGTDHRNATSTASVGNGAHASFYHGAV